MKFTILILLFITLKSFVTAQEIISDDSSSAFLDSINPLYQLDELFKSEEIIEVCLSGSIRKLFNDRGDDAVYHPLRLSFSDSKGNNFSQDIKVKTRGHFRRDRTNCLTPPLLLYFTSPKNYHSSLFVNQEKLKLITACRDDKYVLREYLVYKLYQLITEKSFQVRLIRICYEEKGKKTKPEYGILLEDSNQMAKRNASQLIKKFNMNPHNTNREMFLKMAIFQYLIGNTDWSIQYLHNIKLILSNSTRGYVPVPYDFDHSGIVGAPYAKPSDELHLQSVQERRYRGYCIENIKELDPILNIFNELRSEIYKLYTNNSLIDETYLKSTLRYLDQFYKIINDPDIREKEFKYPCDPNGTGNIVIKGLGRE